MHNLSLSLSVPKTPVLSGENFPAEIAIVNRSGDAVEAPAGIGDNSYVFRLRRLGDGAEIALSRDALMRKSAAGPGERVFPRRTGLRQPLGPGETRTVSVHPAKLATAPLPPGDYEMTVEMIDGAASPSAPVPLSVVAARIVAHHVIGASAMDAPERLLLHAGEAGLVMLGGAGEDEGPLWGAALRVAEVPGPVEDAALALALRTDDEPGAVIGAWLSGGRLSAVVARTAYVVASIGPLDLGLAAPSLSPVGREWGEPFITAEFAVLGVGAAGPELVTVTFGRESGWAPTLRRTALPFAEAPRLWRLAAGPEGGLTLLAAFPGPAGGAVLHRVDIDAAGAAGPAVEALATEGEIVALSAPLRGDSAAHVLSASGLQETSARMALTLLPLDGAPPRERLFLVPLSDGVPPSRWALAEGAPAISHAVALGGDAILGLRFADEVEGVVLTREAGGARGLTPIIVGARGWAVWRDDGGALRQAAFPD